MPNQFDDDTQDLSGTQPITPRSVAPVTGHVQPPAQKYDRRARKRKPNDRGGFYLPAWSVGVMLLLVFGITASIVMLVITLGGGKPSEGQPRVVIITAAPSNTPDQAETPVSITSLPSQQNFQGAIPTFALEGPTLAPIILTSTPISINIGVTVIVNTDDLRIRPDPSLDNKELFFAKLGDRYTVIAGPQQGSGLTWWQVQDTVNPAQKGWAAADYLDVALQ